MARFYSSIQGNRSEATRMGTPASGISGHIRGWNIGARVGIPDAWEYQSRARAVSRHVQAGR